MVKCAKESGGKRLGSSGKKIGTVHLRWACAEAAVLFLRHTQPGKAYFTKVAHRPGKATALTGLAHKLARAVYYLLTREPAVDLTRFVTASPLRGVREPAVSLAHSGQSPRDAPSFYTAQTVREPLDEKPGAPCDDWTVSPAHLLGASSPRTSWLPLPRV